MNMMGHTPVKYTPRKYTGRPVPAPAVPATTRDTRSIYDDVTHTTHSYS